MDGENVTDIDNTDLFLNEDEQVVKNLSVMAAKIAFYNFQWRYIALIVYLSGQYSQAVDTFLNYYNQSVVVKLGKIHPLRYATVPQCVLFGEESTEIADYIQWLVDIKYDNTGKFIIICHSTDYRKCDEYYIFKALAEIYVVNVIFLRAGDKDNEPVLFTYDMILPGKCKNSEPKRLEIRNDCDNDTCFQLLYNDKFRDFYKCPLIVSTFEQPPFMYLHNGTSEPSGGDGDMLKVVTNALNATLVIKTPEDGEDWGHYGNKTWTGSLGDVFNGHAHLSVCSSPLTSGKNGNFQISFIYSTMDIVWVAQLPYLKPPWEKLLRPFNLGTRIAVLLMFICVIILSGLLKTCPCNKLRESLNLAYPRRSLLLNSWIIFLGMPIFRLPSKCFPLLIVYSWIWFCFVIRSCYQGGLISALKEHVYERNFESFKESVMKKHLYGGQGSYREYFVDDSVIYDNWVQLETYTAYTTLNAISNGTSGFVLAFNKEVVIEHLLDHNGSRRLQMIPRKIINSPTVMYMKKYSPLATPLNTILSRAVESGYAQLWHMRFARQRKHLFEHAQNQGPTALSLENVAGCIAIIVVGWLVSILLFILEVYCGYVADNEKERPYVE